MALSDLLKDLDPKYASALSEISESLRHEFDQKLTATRAELGLEAASEEPAEEAQAAPEAPAAAPSDHLEAIEELKHAVITIDAAGSQGEVLDSLVAGCARFSSRCAVFLVRDGRVAGWTSHGFSRSDEDMRAVAFAVEDGTPWALLSEGAGTIALSGDECDSICARLGGEGAEMGLLIPFVLNNQTAAGVYCDRLAGDEPPNVAGLQLVTFIASQVLENLPVRDRASTSTLRLAPSAADIATDTAVVEPPAYPEPEPPAALDEPEPAELEPPAPEIVEPEPAAEEEVVVEEEVEEAPAVEMEEQTWDAGPAADVAAPEVDEAGPDALFEPDAEPDEPTPIEIVDAADEEAAAREAAEPEPAAAMGGFTPAPEAPPEPVAEAIPAGEQPPPPAILSDATTQVVPPSDLEGPGWAFTGAGAAAPESGDESQHEEARRLARLLVTEVKLYNEELVEQGRQKGDVYSVLREDIDRSRQIFEDRIAEDVRSHSDYFREALVRILAGGDPTVLGA